MNKTIQKAINRQINEEFFSAYLYMSMAAYFESINLKGFANWMRVQVQEELIHATKFFNFILNRGGKVELDAIEAPQKEWDSPLAAFQAALEHENHITGCINGLVDIAIKESDHAANNLLQWYVSEQVEEEANVTSIVENLKLMGDAKGGLFMMDRELATRTLPPTAMAALQ